MRSASSVSVEDSSGYVAFESSPAHLLILSLAVLLFATTIFVIVMLWRDSDRSLLEKVIWSAITLLVPVVGPILVGGVLLWQRGRYARSR